MDIFLTVAVASLAVSGLASPSAIREKERFGGYKEAETVVRSQLPSLTQNDVNYLSLFDKGAISKSQDGLSFRGGKRALDLFKVEGLEDPNVKEQSVTFDACYMADLDLCVMEITLGAPGKEPIGSEVAIAFPFVDGRGQRDVRYVLNGHEFLRSSFMEGDRFKPSAEKDMAWATAHSGIFLTLTDSAKSVSWGMPSEEGEGVDGFGIIAPIMGIIDCITGFDRALGLAKRYVGVPDIFIHGPAYYFLFLMRMMLLKDHFEHNSSLLIEDGYIDDQSDLEDFQFSLFGNIAENGCGVVAAYNLLFDIAKENGSGEEISLPTLISLFEALNADFLFGVFGSNPIPHEYYAGLVVLLNLLAAYVVLFAPFIARVIVDTEIAVVESPALKLMLAWTYEMNVALTAAGIVVAIEAALLAVDTIVGYFDAFKSDPGFIVGLYVGSGRCAKRMFDCDGYEGDLIPGARSVVAFWNELDSSSGLANVSKGAHFLFVKRDASTKKYIAYNARKNIVESENLFELIGKSSEDKISHNIASRCIISSFTFNK